MTLLRTMSMTRIFLHVIVWFGVLYETESQFNSTVLPRIPSSPRLTVLEISTTVVLPTRSSAHIIVSSEVLRPTANSSRILGSNVITPSQVVISTAHAVSSCASGTLSIPITPRPSATGWCLSEIVGTLEVYGVFVWPDTSAGSLSILACPYNKESFASRECLYTNQTESGTVWGPVEVNQCKKQDIRSKELFALGQKEVNISNVVKTTQEVKNLSFVNQGRTLQPGDISNIATVLEKIVAVKKKANETSEDFFTTIDNVLDATIENVLRSQQNTNSSSRIVEALNNFVETLVIGPGGKFQKVKRNYALSLQAIKPQTFTGVTFSGTMKKPDGSPLKNNNISTKFTDSVPTATTSSLSIPRTIFNESTFANHSRYQTAIFILYKETKFFRVSLIDFKKTSSQLNSFVIAGSIKGLSFANLSEPVKIVLESIMRGDRNSTLCSYWSFSLGNWSQEGCWFERVLKDGRIVCNCNHLTNFALLMDIYPAMTTRHDRILGIISYVGCGLSLAGLILTIITILILREVRRKIPGQILLNFCIALSLTLIVFLAAVERSKSSSLAACRTAAVTLHYFLLAAFFWMAIEAFNMYLAFVKIFPVSSPSKYMLKCCLFAWGTPAVIVAITMIVALDEYGDNRYCRLHGVPFIVAFLTPVILILVGDMVTFCFIIRSLLSSGSKVTSDRKITGYQRARQGLAIMILLGLTWIFGILAIGDARLVFQYLFCIFNTLQGFFVFIFYCILPVGTRQQLRKLVRKKRNFLWKQRLRQEDQPKKSESRDIPLDNMAYSSNDTATFKTTELTAQIPCIDNPVFQTPLESTDGVRGKSYNLQTSMLDVKIPDVIFSNSDVTHYSVTKNGSNYVTTIELTLGNNAFP